MHWNLVSYPCTDHVWSSHEVYCILVLYVSTTSLKGTSFMAPCTLAGMPHVPIVWLFTTYVQETRLMWCTSVCSRHRVQWRLEPLVASSLRLMIRALYINYMDVLSNYYIGRTVWMGFYQQPTCWCLLLTLHSCPHVYRPVMKVSLCCSCLLVKSCTFFDSRKGAGH